MPGSSSRTITAIYLTPIAAGQSFIAGFSLCLREPSVRKLCIKPWTYGGLVMVVLMVSGFFYLHPLLLNAISSKITGQPVVGEIVAWALGAFLFAFMLVWGLFVVFLLFLYLQDHIVLEVLRIRGVPTVSAGGSIAKEVRLATFAIFRAAILLVFLFPVFVVGFFISFIPLLLPFGLMLTGWALAVQLFDSAWQSLDVPMVRRIKGAFRCGYALTCFGSILTVVSLIPFAVFFLPPIAAAGAGDLVARLRLDKRILDESR